MSRTMGAIICEARKNKGMTQAELAQSMNVTDKAVSKWERDLSCPDVSSIPRLAEALGIPLEELMSGKSVQKTKPDMVELVCSAVGFAMGIAVLVLSVLARIGVAREPVNAGDTQWMLALGLAVLAFIQLRRQ